MTTKPMTMSAKTNLVLAIDNNALRMGIKTTGVVTIASIELLADILTESGFCMGSRAELDGATHHLDENRKRQLLPYVVITNGEGLVRYYRRSAKAGEPRLSGNVSIGYGGHIELGDMRYQIDNQKDYLDISATILSNVKRELDEEVYEGFSSDTSGASLKGLIIDDSNPVGMVHLGLLLVVTITNMDSASKMLGTDPDAGVVDKGWINPAELLASNEPLENWTRMALQYLNPNFAKGAV